MKKFGIIIITAVTVLAMSSLTGCGISFERPSKDGSVSSSENASISDKVENIRVEWVDGKVEFKRHDKDTVDLSEEIKGSG